MRNEAARMGASVHVFDGEAFVVEVVIVGCREIGTDASKVELEEG